MKLLWWTAAVIVVDQATKALAAVTFPNDEFALGITATEPVWMIAVMVAGIVAFGWWLVHSHAPAWVFGLTIGGAISNVADRLIYGSVRDFITVGNVALNIADVAILVGLIGWVFSLSRKEVTP